MLVAKKANINNAKLLFEWANDIAVRKNAISTNQINWEDHLDWLNIKLTDENCAIFIMYINDEAIGQVRFDYDEDNYIIDYSLDGKFRNKGLAKLLLSSAIQKLDIQNLKKKSFKGIVKTDNVASVKTFLGLNFVEISKEEDLKNGLRIFQQSTF